MQIRSILTLLFLLIAAQTNEVAAQSRGAKPTLDKSFSDEVGRPLMISYYQPIIGIDADLLKIDKDGIIEFKKPWHSFYEGDVWLYFLHDPSELELIPNEVSQVFIRAGETPREGLSSYRLRLADGRAKMIMVVMMAGYLDLDVKYYRCQIATLIMLTLQGLEVGQNYEAHKCN